MEFPQIGDSKIEYGDIYKFLVYGGIIAIVVATYAITNKADLDILPALDKMIYPALLLLGVVSIIIGLSSWYNCQKVLEEEKVLDVGFKRMKNNEKLSQISAEKIPKTPPQNGIDVTTVAKDVTTVAKQEAKREV